LNLPGFLQHCGNLAHLTIYPLGQTFPRLLSQFRGVGFSKWRGWKASFETVIHIEPGIAEVFKSKPREWVHRVDSVYDTKSQRLSSWLIVYMTTEPWLQSDCLMPPQDRQIWTVSCQSWYPWQLSRHSSILQKVYTSYIFYPHAFENSSIIEGNWRYYEGRVQVSFQRTKTRTCWGPISHCIGYICSQDLRLRKWLTDNSQSKSSI